MAFLKKNFQQTFKFLLKTILKGVKNECHCKTLSAICITLNKVTESANAIIKNTFQMLVKIQNISK